MPRRLTSSRVVPWGRVVSMVRPPTVRIRQRARDSVMTAFSNDNRGLSSCKPSKWWVTPGAGLMGLSTGGNSDAAPKREI